MNELRRKILYNHIANFPPTSHFIFNNAAVIIFQSNIVAATWNQPLIKIG